MFEVAREHNLHKTTLDIKVYTGFKIVQVKVPMNFFDTPVFRHAGMDVYYSHIVATVPVFYTRQEPT